MPLGRVTAPLARTHCRTAKPARTAAATTPNDRAPASSVTLTLHHQQQPQPPAHQPMDSRSGTDLLAPRAPAARCTDQGIRIRIIGILTRRLTPFLVDSHFDSHFEIPAEHLIRLPRANIGYDIFGRSSSHRPPHHATSFQKENSSHRPPHHAADSDCVDSVGNSVLSHYGKITDSFTGNSSTMSHYVTLFCVCVSDLKSA